MPGDLPAAVHVDHRDARIGERAVERAGTPAGGVDGLVLQQQAGVRDVPVRPPCVQILLEPPAVQIRNRAGTKTGPGKDQLAIHLASLSGIPEPPRVLAGVVAERGVTTHRRPPGVGGRAGGDDST
jgi:hypothetical protein